MKTRAIDIFVITSLVAHAAILVNYLPEKPGGFQSGNSLDITLESISSRKNTGHQISNNLSAAKRNTVANNHNTKKPVVKTSNKEHPPEIINTSLLKRNSPSNSTQANIISSSRGGHILRNKLNLLLANNFSYPQLARKNNWYGTVEISLRIELNGTISKITLAKSSGYEILDKAALANIRTIATIPDAHKWLGNNHYDLILPIEYRLIDS